MENRGMEKKGGGKKKGGEMKKDRLSGKGWVAGDRGRKNACRTEPGSDHDCRLHLQRSVSGPESELSFMQEGNCMLIRGTRAYSLFSRGENEEQIEVVPARCRARGKLEKGVCLIDNGKNPSLFPI